MTRWKKRMLTGVLSVAALLTLAVPAMASEEIDVTQEGTVQLTVADEADHRADLTESEGTILVYKLADMDANGVFTLAERFAALGENEQWNGGVLTGNTRAQDLLDAAMEQIVPKPAEGEATGESEEPALEPDQTLQSRIVGGELKLGVGLYVLVPEKIETELWVYTFSPMLLSVPSTAEGSWTFELPVTMKAEREPRLTELVIEKTLSSYNATLGPTTFVFDVEAEKDGANVYSNVVSLTFSGTGTRSATVSGIPVGAHVTVTEVYSGASYTPAGGRVSVEIEELPLAKDGNAERVGFTNDYNNYRVPDDSVVNTFQFDGTGWKWQSSEEAGR